ncbi:bacterial Ig-like domain-containing protein [Allofournierella sp. CML151]|uniref:bacterial Ig-like domain-containing protein n=1 Tax=Allofournierella sp. CML151 TaxID=2998082 RepID=UPI0022EA8C48|nr:PT domain-containing protein [Fournierella sp. CML151]
MDARIGGTGLIVYRVDTTVDGLSNYFGSTGVYVFRPQPGQNGYVEGSERATVGNAFLSAESGRTSIGSADPGAGLAQGALPFSDGTNSGIVISDVSSAQGGSMTFSVTIPEADPQTLWQDAQFPEHSGVALAQGSIRGQIMAAGYALPYTGDQLRLYAFADPGWAPVTEEPLTQAGGFDRVTLTSLRDTPVVAWRASDGALYLAILADGAWKSLGSLPDVDDYAITAQGGTLHLAYVTGGYSQAGYATITGSGISRQGFCASGRMFGSPKAAVTGQGQVYLAFRDVTNNNDLLIYQAQDGGFSRLASPGSASSYDLAAGSSGLMAVLGGDTPVVKQLDGDSWTELARLDQTAHEPRLAFGADTTFLLTAPNGASAKDLRVYQQKDGTFTPVGDRVDKGGDGAALTVFGDRLFTAYRMDGKAMVRFNAPGMSDALLSLSVTPPALTSYHLGDEVSTQGLQVFANYTSGPRELTAGEYTLTGFDASQTGTRQATVSYQGMSSSFSFTVFEAAVPTAVPTAEPTAVPTAQPTAVPSAKPTAVPSAKPTAVPSAQPTAVPSAQPTAVPSAKPTAVPSAQPTAVPSAQPTAVPSAQPTSAPAAGPTSVPATAAPAATIPPSTAVIRPARPTAQPTAAPTASPTAVPSAVPTAQPTEQPSPTPDPSSESASAEAPSSGGVLRPQAALLLAGVAGVCACVGIGLWFFFKRR